MAPVGYLPGGVDIAGRGGLGVLPRENERKIAHEIRVWAFLKKGVLYLKGTISRVNLSLKKISTDNINNADVFQFRLS